MALPASFDFQILKRPLRRCTPVRLMYRRATAGGFNMGADSHSHTDGLTRYPSYSSKG
jgi:hypothetical protein